MNDSMNEVVIVEAIRTPIGTYKGSLKEIRSDQLGSMVIKEVLKIHNFDKEDIDEVIMGQVLTAGTGQNPARQAAINAGISISKPAYIVNQVCGSGLRAVISGYQSIKLVRLLGFEPRTSLTVAKRSIQLSYRRKLN